MNRAKDEKLTFLRFHEFGIEHWLKGEGEDAAHMKGKSQKLWATTEMFFKRYGGNFSKEWETTFDIINLDLCGHMTLKVVTALSVMFNARTLNDCGVFAITSLASREQEFLQNFLSIPLFMNTIMQFAVRNELHQMGYNWANGNDDNFDRAREERQGLDSAVIFIALGDKLFVSLMKGLDEVRQGNKNAIVDSINGDVYQSILNAQENPSALVPYDLKRLFYMNGPSAMRSSFLFFRNLRKLKQEIDYDFTSLCYALSKALASPVQEITTPVAQPANKSSVLNKIALGQFVVET